MQLRTVSLGDSLQPQTNDPLLAAISGESRRAFLLGVLAAVATATVGLLVEFVAPSSDVAGWGILIAVIGTPIALAVVYTRRLRRRFWPAVEVLRWGSERWPRLWLEIDGESPPPTPQVGLERVAGRTDDPAELVRIDLLLASGRRDAALTELERWNPTEPVWLARRACVAVQFWDPVDMEARFEQAHVALAAIADPVSQANEAAMLAQLEADRLAAAGQDPFPSLLAARTALEETGLNVSRTLFPGSPGDRLRRGVGLVAFGVAVVCLVWVAFVAVWSVFVPSS